MVPLSTALLLVHPFLALLIVLWLVRQHGWRKGGGTLKGEARREALAEHVRSGECLLVATVGLVLVAVLARAAAGYIEEGRITAMLLPTNLHGWTGPIGLWVLWTTVRHGRQALAAMDNKESIVAPRTRHGLSLIHI